jgi:hypothetical protein
LHFPKTNGPKILLAQILFMILIALNKAGLCAQHHTNRPPKKRKKKKGDCKSESVLFVLVERKGGCKVQSRY